MFQGEPDLRKSGEVIDVDQKTINEYIKCREDIIYFAEKYFYIIHPDMGKIKIPLYEWQRRILKAYVDTPKGRKHCITKIARQSGKCCHVNTMIKIRNKKTKEIKEVSIGEFLGIIKNLNFFKLFR